MFARDLHTEAVSISLSGAVFMQVVMYFQIYRHDFPLMKVVVRVIRCGSLTCLLIRLVRRFSSCGRCNFLTLPLLRSFITYPRVLDIVHSVMICTAEWQLLIINYGAFATLDHIAWPISVGGITFVQAPFSDLGPLDNNCSHCKLDNLSKCYHY